MMTYNLYAMTVINASTQTLVVSVGLLKVTLQGLLEFPSTFEVPPIILGCAKRSFSSFFGLPLPGSGDVSVKCCMASYWRLEAICRYWHNVLATRAGRCK